MTFYLMRAATSSTPPLRKSLYNDQRYSYLHFFKKPTKEDSQVIYGILLKRSRWIKIVDSKLSQTFSQKCSVNVSKKIAIIIDFQFKIENQFSRIVYKQVFWTVSGSYFHVMLARYIYKDPKFRKLLHLFISCLSFKSKTYNKDKEKNSLHLIELSSTSQLTQFSLKSVCKIKIIRVRRVFMS